MQMHFIFLNIHQISGKKHLLRSKSYRPEFPE